MPETEAGGGRSRVEQEDSLGTALRAGVPSFPGMVMQSFTHIALAIATLFFIQFVVSQASLAAPLTYPIGFLIVLLLGINLSQLAKHIPSAGGYCTYVSRSACTRVPVS